MSVRLDAATTVATKMSKREAASLVRFLTSAIAETETDLIDVRIDLRNDSLHGDSYALISVDNNTLFGSTSAIIETRVIKYEQVEAN
jgi:hypothetical protein